MSDIKNIRDQFVSKLKNELSLDEINSIKTELFGKNGQISSLFKTVGSIPESDRKTFAKVFLSDSGIDPTVLNKDEI